MTRLKFPCTNWYAGVLESTVTPGGANTPLPTKIPPEYETESLELYPIADTPSMCGLPLLGPL